MSLKGKIAMVTGASRGIGKAIALGLAKEGAIVIVNYCTAREQAEAVVKEVQDSGGEAVAIQADVSKSAAVKEMFQTVKEKYARLDILVNNAGILKDALIMMTSEKDWDEILDTNLKGMFLCMQHATKMMMKQRGGKIINVSSIVGIEGNVGQVAYAASKAGVVGLTKSAAKELGAYNILVNTVAPGFILSDMTSGLKEEVKKKLIASIGLGRAGTPEDVVGTVLFLASKKADYVTGQVIGVDGGMVL